MKSKQLLKNILGNNFQTGAEQNLETVLNFSKKFFLA